MAAQRRLTQQQRHEIARKHAEGASVEVLSREFGVTRRSIYYTLKANQDRLVDGHVRSELVNVRVTKAELQTFDAAILDYGISSRADALRRLIHAANGFFVTDVTLAEELSSLSASLNRAGNNVNQIAQRLNEAKRRGQVPPYNGRSDVQIKALAGLVFDLADQVQEMAQRRRATLSLEIAHALEGFADGP